MVSEKLSKYIAAAGALGGVVGANSQIVYTDVDPDLTLFTISDSTVVVPIDLDGDSNDDFGIMALHFTSASPGSSYSVNGVGLVPASSNQWAGVSTSFGSSVVPALQLMNSGSSVNSGLSWQSSYGWAAVELNGSTSYMGSFSLDIGRWFAEDDGYAGVRFLIGGDVHYGWMRFDVSANGDTITLKDYAYHSQSDSSITAGQMTTSIEDNKGLNVLITGVVDQISIRVPSIQGTAEFELQDMSGKLVYNTTLKEEVSQLRVNQPTGVYIARVSYADRFYTKKVYLGEY